MNGSTEGDDKRVGTKQLAGGDDVHGTKKYRKERASDHDVFDQ
jgi:hypothetical protein